MRLISQMLSQNISIKADGKYLVGIPSKTATSIRQRQRLVLQGIPD